MERLTRVIVSNEGELQTSRLPSSEEMMSKLNEIVDWINRNENLLEWVAFEKTFGKFRSK